MQEDIEPEPPPEIISAPNTNQINLCENTYDSDTEEDMHSCNTHITETNKNTQAPTVLLTHNMPELQGLTADEYSSDDDSLFDNWDATHTEKHKVQEVMCNLQHTGRNDIFPAIQSCDIALDENNSYDNDDIYLTKPHNEYVKHTNPSKPPDSAINIEGVDIFPTHVTETDWTTWYGRSKEEEIQIHSSTIGDNDACYKSAVDRLDALLEEHYYFDCATIPKETEIEDDLEENMDKCDLNNVIQTLSHAQVTTTSVTPKVLQQLIESSQEIDMRVKIEQKPKLMDGGSNRNLTNLKHIIRNFRTIRKIPVNGVAAGEPTCFISGVGLVDLLTKTGDILTIKMFYSEQCQGTILSPNSIVQDSDGKFTSWIHCAHMDIGTGAISFFHRHNPAEECILQLKSKNQLWFISQPTRSLINKSESSEMFYDSNPDRAYAGRLSSSAMWTLWHQRTMHAGDKVMEALPHCVDGVPKHLASCKNHFQKCNCCSRTQSVKPSGNIVEEQKTSRAGQRFHFDFGFIRSEDFSEKNKRGNIITSYDGYNSYLIAVDKHTRYMWIFLSKTKLPPLKTVDKFLKMHGIKDDKLTLTIRTDRGGELSGSQAFEDLIGSHGYNLERTGADSSSQNGIAERPNRTLGNILRSTLYGAGLSGKYWSDIILQAVFVKNRLPHAYFNYKTTPYTAFTGKRPNFTKLRVPGSEVAVVKPGRRKTFLSVPTYDGIFLRYGNTIQNCVYLDTKTNRVKTARIDSFDEAHFHKKNRPPAADELVNSGYKKDTEKHPPMIPTAPLDCTITDKNFSKTPPNRKLLIKKDTPKCNRTHEAYRRSSWIRSL